MSSEKWNAIYTGPVFYKQRKSFLEKELPSALQITPNQLKNLVEYINLYNSDPSYYNPNCDDCLLSCPKCFPTKNYMSIEEEIHNMSIAVGRLVPSCICPQKPKK